MLFRQIYKEIMDSLAYFPVVAIVGPRQVGKTTLATQIMSQSKLPAIYLDMEKPSDLNKLNHAEFFLSQHQDELVIIDEVQEKKDLYPLLRSLVDQHRKSGRFLLLGSASPDLIRHSSQSLAGRIAYHRLFPFNITEVPSKISLNALWIKGGFPHMILASDENRAWQWMENFIDTYLNRDLIQLGLDVSPKIIRNLWSMMAHINGSLLNVTTLGKSLGVTTPTVKRYLDFLEDAFLIKSLQPFTLNMKKRLVKSPKVYIADTGILHHLIGMCNFEELAGHPGIGASWETFVINQIQSVKRSRYDTFFYRTHQGAEVDLVITRGNSVKATVEIKFTDSPRLSKGNYNAFDDLNARNNFVITPSSDDYLIKEGVRVCSLKDFIFKYLPEL